MGTSDVVPILYDYKDSHSIQSIPWAMLAPHEDRVRKNHHGQTLAEMSAAGGFTSVEALAILEDLDFLAALRLYGLGSAEDSRLMLRKRIECFQRAAQDRKGTTNPEES